MPQCPVAGEVSAESYTGPSADTGFTRSSAVAVTADRTAYDVRYTGKLSAGAR